ncbi:hypothetical protein GCM10009601_08840 [Streptomyces thermospinosisporus]|uniref:ATP-grasp-modified RiPP n=1 Tax=Streptomyces thermospinosisporus TaxID=161482 RepID=A0ABN1YL06_9ACTN
MTALARTVSSQLLSSSRGRAVPHTQGTGGPPDAQIYAPGDARVQTGGESEYNRAGKASSAGRGEYSRD